MPCSGAVMEQMEVWALTEAAKTARVRKSDLVNMMARRLFFEREEGGMASGGRRDQWVYIQTERSRLSDRRLVSCTTSEIVTGPTFPFMSHRNQNLQM